MRAWAFLLSFYLVFGQIYYAHSALPVAVATAKGVGTLVRSGVIMHGAGALARSSYKWCKANKVKCAGLLGSAYDLIMGDDDDDDDTKATCRYRFALGTSDTPLPASTAYNKLLQNLKDQSPSNDYTHHPKHDERVGKNIKEHRAYIADNPSHAKNFRDWGLAKIDTTFYFVKYPSQNTYVEGQANFFMYAKCSTDDFAYDDEVDRERREKELWDKLKDKLSDDDITNIVNNYGDDIDIDKYCASGATCYFLDVDFEKEINNNDYDIDKINNKNCETRNGKIYSCEKAKKKKDRDDDDDGQTNKDKDDDDDGQTNKDKDNQTLPNLPNINIPRFCTWAKPVCDWLDWSKEPLKDQDTRLNIPSPSGDSIDTNINASGSCPTDIVIQGSFAGRQFEFFRFEWSKFCQWLFIIKPIIIAMASFGAVKIVGGVNVAG